MMLLNWIAFSMFILWALFLKLTRGDFEDIAWALFFAVIIRIQILEASL